MYPDHEFAELYGKACYQRANSGYADAADLYRRALRTGGGPRDVQLWAKVFLAHCLEMLGQMPEATALLGIGVNLAWCRGGFAETRNL